jgi:hypothetical protein
MTGVKKVLAPRGNAIASIRFCNEHNQLMGDSNEPEWIYPEVSYFAWETVQNVATEFGLVVGWRKDYREFFTTKAFSPFRASAGQRPALPVAMPVTFPFGTSCLFWPPTFCRQPIGGRNLIALVVTTGPTAGCQTAEQVGGFGLGGAL